MCEASFMISGILGDLAFRNRK